MTAAHQPRPTTVETFHPHPGAEHTLRCPNQACQSPDDLVLLETATVATPAEFFDVGVTDPEIDRQDDLEKIEPGRRTVTGVRCDKCRWSYVGPKPLSRLLPVE